MVEFNFGIDPRFIPDLYEQQANPQIAGRDSNLNLR